MTFNENLLSNKRIHKEKTFFFKKKSLTSTHIGDFTRYINNNKILLNDVLLISNFNKNLISLCQLIKQKYKVIFNSSNNNPSVTIYDPKGKRITNTEANSYSNTFRIWISRNKIVNTTETNEIFLLENNYSSAFSNSRNVNFTI